jgi:hypothetical protein
MGAITSKPVPLGLAAFRLIFITDADDGEVIEGVASRGAHIEGQLFPGARRFRRLGPALKQRAPDNDASADLPASRTMKRSRNFSTGPWSGDAQQAIEYARPSRSLE